MDLLKPEAKNYSLKKKRPDRCFEIGQTVWIRDYRNSSAKWIPGVIERRIGQLMYEVKVTLHSMPVKWKRHADQLMSRESDEEISHHKEDNEEKPSTRSQLSETTTSEITTTPWMMRRSTLATDGDTNLPSSQNSDSLVDVSSSSSAVAISPGSMTMQTSQTRLDTATGSPTVIDRPTSRTVRTACGRQIKTPAKFDDFVIHK